MAKKLSESLLGDITIGEMREYTGQITDLEGECRILFGDNDKLSNVFTWFGKLQSVSQNAKSISFFLDSMSKIEAFQYVHQEHDRIEKHVQELMKCNAHTMCQSILL